MDSVIPSTKFWKGKKVLITGHTGFKGCWLTIYLQKLGAILSGIALKPQFTPNMFQKCHAEGLIRNYFVDIRDFRTIEKVIQEIDPEVIFHLAAQPLVLKSLKNPIDTYSTNVMGSLNILESLRSADLSSTVLMISSDKCYQNNNWVWGYRENDTLGGADIYSSSKACMELMISSFRHSLANSNLTQRPKIALATARAGNVIGGGDWAENRLIPDIIRAITKKEKLIVRHPNATRPWQHVLEPLTGYILLAEKLHKSPSEFESAWNFGPEMSNCKSVRWIVENFPILGAELKLDANFEAKENSIEHRYLHLDSSKAKSSLSWKPRLDLEQALQFVGQWHKHDCCNSNMLLETQKQLERYLEYNI